MVIAMEQAHRGWVEEAKTVCWDGRPFIGGTRRRTAGESRVPSINPATGHLLYELEECTQGDVDTAVAQARAAYNEGSWSRADPGFRRDCLTRLADLVLNNARELALRDSLEMGKPVREAFEVDVPGAAGTIRYYAEAIDKINGEVSPTPNGATAMVTREPLGVVGIIVAWNYPLEIATWKLAPALATGNSVVIKPAAEASQSVLRLAELAIEAGIPAGVFNVVTGRGSVVGEMVGRHMDIDMVAFTGSTSVAKKLQVYAGESNLKRLSLEAGGKSANIIFADSQNFELAAEKAAFGSFYNQGQVCSATSRVLVERSIYDSFIELFAKKARAYWPADPLDENAGNGCLVSEAHAKKVRRAIELGRRDGRLILGYEEGATMSEGPTFVPPTIVTDLPHDHILNKEEIFGPVAVVTPFDSEEEAVSLANGTDFGLAAAVWTSSISKANRVAKQLISGTVSINTVDALSFVTPFGGFKQSGFGRDLSLHAMDNYTALKTTWVQWGE